MEIQNDLSYNINTTSLSYKKKNETKIQPETSADNNNLKLFLNSDTKTELKLKMIENEKAYKIEINKNCNKINESSSIVNNEISIRSNLSR